MKKTIISRLPVCLIALTLVSSAWGVVKPNALFSDNAVLQRDMPVPVWGIAAPGEKVTVEFAKQKKVATADAQGQWKVTLDSMPASGESRELRIAGNLGSEISNVICANVLVGEVWICAGQSNMAYGGKVDTNAATQGPKLRMFTVEKQDGLKPRTDMTGKWGEWTPGGKVSSGVGYYFGRDILKATGVPVGMIRSAVGGTHAALWISLTGLEKEPALRGYAESTRKAMDKFDAAAEAKFAQELADYPAQLKEWEQKVGKEYLESVKVWTEKSKNNRGGVGAPVGPMPQPPVPKPAAPKDLSRSCPSVLFNGMIAPLIPYAIKGTIWYQGESNNGKPYEYRTLFPRLIGDWREQWGGRDFPFLFVQIAPQQAMTPELREAQFLSWKKTPNTAMAVITDVGDAKNIHPPQKEPVGARLALAARALAYGEKLEYSGPEYDSFTADKSRVVLSFKHVGGGLVAKDGPLKGFTIAGADHQFVPAKAEIVNDTIVVSSDQVPAPVAARYGWANVPDVNLWNKAGLPASPFRTDVESRSQDTSGQANK